MAKFGVQNSWQITYFMGNDISEVPVITVHDQGWDHQEVGAPARAMVLLLVPLQHDNLVLVSCLLCLNHNLSYR